MTTTSVTKPQTKLVQPEGQETSFFLVRHGRTASNVARRLHGATDIPLDAIGFGQAERIAERLVSEAPFDAIITSPLQRAAATAQVLGAKINMEPTLDAGLVEMNFGALEGHTLDRIRNEHPELARQLDNLSDDELTWPGGESRRGFHARVLGTFQSILNDFSRGKVVVVAHLGVLSSLLAQISNQNTNDWSAFPLANCTLTHLVIRSDGHVLHCVNNAGHLTDLSLDVSPVALK
ncbi:MAG: histidine phosphatase family protein [Chloroflexota bacterium]|nr:histidine phosphatase family protein [Chloroflexota bacterium]